MRIKSSPRPGSLSIVLLLAAVLGPCCSALHGQTNRPGTNRPATLEERMAYVRSHNLNPSTVLVGEDAPFAITLFQAFRPPRTNLCLSPYAIGDSLAVAQAGARGEAQASLAEKMGYTQEHYHDLLLFSASQRRIDALPQTNGLELRMAYGLWAQPDHPLLPQYVQDMKLLYGAEINPANFRADPDAVVNQINGWVNRATHDRVSDVVAPHALNSSNRAALVSAAYFKNRWARAFAKSNTVEAPFARDTNDYVKVRFMQTTAQFAYADLRGAQMLELPCDGGDFSMLILLPATHDVLPPVEDNVSASYLRDWFSRLHETNVELSLPRFKLTTSFALRDVLSRLDLGFAFSPEADFSGINGAHDLFLANVWHKSTVEIDEDGAEPASPAATQAGKPVVFRADHPFLFFIRDNRTGGILFMGRMADPTK